MDSRSLLHRELTLHTLPSTSSSVNVRIQMPFMCRDLSGRLLKVYVNAYLGM